MFCFLLTCIYGINESAIAMYGDEIASSVKHSQQITAMYFEKAASALQEDCSEDQVDMVLLESILEQARTDNLELSNDNYHAFLRQFFQESNVDQKSGNLKIALLVLLEYVTDKLKK